LAGAERRAEAVIIDAWMQHPSAEFLADPMFESLRRWTRGQLAGGEVPVEATVGSNHPAWPAAECLADLAGLQLDDQTTDLFLHGNAERVFGLTGSALEEDGSDRMGRS
jgi:hypothetical protein